jgi:hypothetical protein
MHISTLATKRRAAPARAGGLIYVTESERAWLMRERVRAICATPGIRLSACGRWAVGPKPVRAQLCVAERDRDGGLLAAVRVTHGETGASRYVRKLRGTLRPSQEPRDVPFNRRRLTSLS